MLGVVRQKYKRSKVLLMWNYNIKYEIKGRALSII